MASKTVDIAIVGCYGTMGHKPCQRPQQVCLYQHRPQYSTVHQVILPPSEMRGVAINFHQAATT
ncbi:hypothetical protein CTI12_AA428610 [Artemisia annua]|uniref:Uncharacterized protein n=1 Tax=Artemisia annua TaxID=35608 RepID=A0A2U1M275_ARTAN|nr:hypothetical protein CTI12_AA428610 [Artemisia annua]